MEKKRCSWAKGPLMTAYHDQEWGKPLHDDQKLFELLCLEMMQAGLSWEIVLKKREHMRQAFDGFQIAAVAAYGEEKIEELMENRDIIRNRRKILAVRNNACAYMKIQEEYGSFDSYLWSFTDGRTIRNAIHSMEEMPAKSPLSERLSKDLKKRGFQFAGPVILYSYLQSAGLVNDHFVDCPCYNKWQQDK